MEQTKIVVGENGAETVPLTEADLKQQKEDQDNAHVASMAFLRLERNAKLAASDWRGSSDNTMSDEWKSYRAELRDFPEKVDLTNIVWPKEPT
tara:strand:- start:325 stop:603 length:279 start_codon:yes stop_codon:yes gene_type:complete